MADVNGEVNSNYGYQWGRHNQLDYVVAKLKENPNVKPSSFFNVYSLFYFSYN